MKCPYCGSLEWTSIKKAPNGVNIIIKCINCLKERKTDMYPNGVRRLN